MFTGISDAKQACIEIYCLSTVPGLEMVYLLKKHRSISCKEGQTAIRAIN